MIDVVCHHCEPVKAPMLRQAILPAIESLAGVAVQLERHWSPRPHVRIRLNGPRPWVRNAAVMLVRRLRTHLSVRLEPTDTAALQDQLGSSEAVQCRAAVLRHGLPAVAASVHWLGGTGDTSGARIRLAVAAMAAQAGGHALGLRHGARTFLSHVEDFLLRLDPSARVRAGFESSWTRAADATTVLVARVAGAEPTGVTESAWRDWTVLARTTAEPFYDRHSHGFTTDLLYSLLELCDVTPVERYLAAYLVCRATERVTGAA